MISKSFPHCCTAKIIMDFGESAVAEGGNFEVDPEELEHKIVRKIEFYANEDVFGETVALVTAITNTEQKTANKVLRKIGFKHSKWMDKKAHPETKIRLWWYHVKEIVDYGKV